MTNASGRIVVVDNGGSTIKAGYAGCDAPAFVVPNCILKPKGHLVQQLVADKTENIKDASQATFSRPIERGYVVNWNYEHDIWSRLFSMELLNLDPPECSLVCTQPYFTPTPLKEAMDEVVFEEFGFSSFSRVNGAEMSIWDSIFSKHSPSTASMADFSRSPCQLVVDSGFSFTHVTPFYLRNSVPAAVRRLNVGGKLLTNYLKETISFRQWNMMEEFNLMNNIKEKLCYMSRDFIKDLSNFEKGDKQLLREYVLPDFHTNMTGFARDYDPDRIRRIRMQRSLGVSKDAVEQVMLMGIERISVPEVIFHPSDIGIRQAGLAETIVDSVSACPKELQGLMYENILIVGGNTKFENFSQRLHSELRAIVPTEFRIQVYSTEDPTLSAWRGASKFFGEKTNEVEYPGISSSEFLMDPAEWNQLTEEALQERSTRFVTKLEYEEHGSRICEARFGF